jgi:inner membrane protein involved in colicin E2 resistance
VATSITDTGFTANWTAPAIGTVTNYLLDVASDPSFNNVLTGYDGLSVSGTSRSVTGLNPVTTYYYRVRANKTSVLILKVVLSHHFLF